MKDWIVTAAAASIAPLSPGRLSAEVMRHGTMTLRYYAPKGADPQTPHDQDEIYIVISGHGTFVKERERRPFGPGDLIFVEAGAEHRFEDYGPDFATWVVFWGPKGGEIASLRG